MNTLPASFPPVDALIETLSAVDWKRQARRTMLAAATVAAVAVAVTLWAIRTGRQFWADHGTTITAATKTAAVRIAAAAVTIWQVAGPILGRLANRTADAVYYWICNGRPITLPLCGPTMAL